MPYFFSQPRLTRLKHPSRTVAQARGACRAAGTPATRQSARGDALAALRQLLSRMMQAMLLAVMKSAPAAGASEPAPATPGEVGFVSNVWRPHATRVIRAAQRRTHYEPGRRCYGCTHDSKRPLFVSRAAAEHRRQRQGAAPRRALRSNSSSGVCMLVQSTVTSHGPRPRAARAPGVCLR